MKTNAISHSQQRLEFLDSLRGVAMLAVIYFHLCVYLLGYSTAFNDIIDRWNMPLFFFLSGLFTYSPIYDACLLKKRVSNRLKQQLYPTVLVWLLFIFASWMLSDSPLSEHIRHGLYDPAKVGYWFTFSLVQVFLIYAVGAYLLTALSVSVGIQTLIYIALILIFSFAAVFMVDEQTLTGVTKKVWNTLSLGKTLTLVPFFMAGALAGMHRNRLLKLMDNTWFVLCSLALFCVLSFSSPVSENTTSAVYFLSRFAGLAFIVSLFTSLRSYVDSKTRIGRYLQRIGRNTLPIYLFHFFMILIAGYFIDEVKPILQLFSSNTAIEIITFTTISAIFAEVCLLADSILRMSPCVHKTIFAK